MRQLIFAAGAAALLGLAGCSKPAPPPVAAAPAEPKALGRMQQFYAGQDQIQSVESGAISIGPNGLAMTAKGVAAGPGYINAGFMRRIYAAQPKDGIYEMDVVADKPATPAGPDAATPIEVKGAWEAFPKDRLKGIRFMTKTNSVVAMLPGA